ncbi:MAG: RHS repeat-associated core domain-containing protein [Chloroflexota bacterium]
MSTLAVSRVYKGRRILTAIRYRFTGQREEAALGLYDYNARWYDPYLNRFLSPDSIVPDPYNPIDWDRYNYIRNNPVKYIDEDGHFPVLPILAIIGGFILFSQVPSDQYQSDPSNHGDPVVMALGLMLMTAPAFGPGLCLNDGNCMNEIQAVSNIGQGLSQDGDPLNEAQAVSQVVNKGLNLLRTNAGQGYNSFTAFKNAQGSAGSGMAWHHIVEQNPANISRFGTQAVNNTSNLIRLPSGARLLHQQISGYYSSIQPLVTGSDILTVRQWLQTKSFEFQWKFGIELIEKFGGTKYILDQFGDKAK